MSDTLRDDYLDVVDDLRGLADEFGIRLFSVTVRVRTWSGSRPGVDASTSTDADKPIWVGAGQYRARVRQVNQREVIASNGKYSSQDIKVGPITPPYAGGAADNSDVTVFDPTPGASPTEVFFLITGPGMGASGSWFSKIGQDVTGPLSYYFTLRRAGVDFVPPP